MLTFSVSHAEQPVLLPFRKGSMSMIHAITVLCHRRTNSGDITLISVYVCVCVCAHAHACACVCMMELVRQDR